PAARGHRPGEILARPLVVVRQGSDLGAAHQRLRRRALRVVLLRLLRRWPATARGRGRRRGRFGQVRAQIHLELHPGPRVLVERGDHRVAPVAPVPAVAQRDRALAIRLGQDLELAREAPHEQALEARLLRVAELGVARAELAAGGVDAVDEIEQLGGGGLDAAGEDTVRLEQGAALVASALAHAAELSPAASAGCAGSVALHRRKSREIEPAFPYLPGPRPVRYADLA